MFSFAWRCNSLTHDLALSRDDYITAYCVRLNDMDEMMGRESNGGSYSLGNVVDNNCTVGVSIVHGREGLISFLASGIPYLKLHCRALIEGDRLGEERGANGRFPIVIKLILEVD
jgi:hypothetical protein